MKFCPRYCSIADRQFELCDQIDQLPQKLKSLLRRKKPFVTLLISVKAGGVEKETLPEFGRDYGCDDFIARYLNRMPFGITMYEYAADHEKRFLEFIRCSGFIKVRNSH